MDTTTPIKIVFWGTDDFVLPVLESLHAAGLTPGRVVTTPDRLLGRKKLLTPSPVKLWAHERGIPVDEPQSLREYSLSGSWDLFIVASYGKIIPQRILDIPRWGTLNIHPSLLPKFRGPSPVPSTILSGETETGVAVMQLDAEMDHGPILAEAPYSLTSRETTPELLKILFTIGGQMVAELVRPWVEGLIVPREQDHSEATFTRKFTGEDGLLDLESMSASEIDRRVRALNPEPGTYTFFDIRGVKTRVKILETELLGDELKIKSVQPEGKTPMTWERFQKLLA